MLGVHGLGVRIGLEKTCTRGQRFCVRTADSNEIQAVKKGLRLKPFSICPEFSSLKAAAPSILWERMRHGLFGLCHNKLKGRPGCGRPCAFVLGCRSEVEVQRHLNLTRAANGVAYDAQAAGR